MLNQLINILKSFGVSQSLIRTVIIVGLSVMGTHYITKVWQKNEADSIQIEKLTVAVNSLSEKIERGFESYNKKLNIYNDRLENAESAIIDISIFNEKASKESIAFLNNITTAKENYYVYHRIVNRVEELQLDYLPTKKGFIDKTEKLKEQRNFDKTNKLTK